MDVVNLLKSIKRKGRKRKTQKYFEHLFCSVKMDFGLVKKKKNTQLKKNRYSACCKSIERDKIIFTLLKHRF